jgi:hypothetical protein
MFERLKRDIRLAHVGGTWRGKLRWSGEIAG